MKRLLVLVLFLSALGTSTAMAGGVRPEVYNLKASAVGYRSLPQPITTPYFVTCTNTTGNCLTNAITFKVRDLDSSALSSRYKVTNSSGQLVSQTDWRNDPMLQTGEGYQHNWFWAPNSSTAAGFYRLWVQVKDAQGNLSAWAVSEPIPFL